MSDETPYAIAVALRKSGASDARIGAALRARGLDNEGIALLLQALGARDASAPDPEAEWTPEPEAASSTAPAGSSVASAATGDQPCARCGVFLTPMSTERVLGVDYCSACAARPEVNYPRAFRDANWGKRDTWAWFYGVTGALSVLVGAFALLASPIAGAFAALTGACGILFWAGVSVGRAALVMSAVVSAAFALVTGNFPSLISLAFVVAAMRSPRNRLFYRLEVPEDELAEAWRESHDNQPARWALGFGFVSALSLLTWSGSRHAAVATLVGGVLTAVVGAYGLTRVDPKATPPIGRRGQALIGLALGVLVALASAVALTIQYKAR